MRPKRIAPYFAAFTEHASAMRILVDTDAFCKLAIGGVLSEAIRLLAGDLSECERLAALPYMLKRGGLREIYGAERCDALIPLVNEMPTAKLSNETWLQPLVPVPEIDPGEALLFARAAETDYLLLTNDKRALRALKDVTGITARLTGRIVVLESVFLALCDHLGPEEVRCRTRALGQLDTVVRICFSDANSDPEVCLRSYFGRLTDQVRPLVLWSPSAGALP